MEQIIETPTNRIATVQESQVALSTEQTMINLIANLAGDPNTDVEKMERLLDVQLKMLDRQAKIDYDNALADLQALMPRITAKGEIKNKDGKVTSKYMRYQDIDLIIRPLLKQFGFSLMHDRIEQVGKMIVKTTLKHRNGHQESVSIPLPYDTPNALKNAVQAASSTASYGMRINVCSLLNIVAEGEDDDAFMAEQIKIDDQQAHDIKEALRETNADVLRFLAFMGVDCVENIAMKDFEKAQRTLNRKIAQVAITTDGVQHG